MTHEPDSPEILTSGPEPDRSRGLWRRRSARARTITAATTIAVLTLGGTVAYAATSGDGEGSTTPSASASDAPDRPGERHHRGPWFGPGGSAVHGEATVKDGDSGEWIVRVWQRGTVEKVDGDQVTLRSEDGAEWTWTVDSDTVGSDTLKDGDDVYLAGTRSDGGERTADHVLAGTWEKPDAEDRRDKLPWRDGRDGPPWNDAAA